MNKRSEGASRKQELRRALRAARRALPPRTRTAAARRARRHLLRWPALRRARRVALHWSVASELDTHALIAALHALGKRVYLPHLANGAAKTLRFVRWQPGAHLRRNRHGIAEPWGTPRIGLRRLDLIVLPLLGFDDNGHRLGTGGGYYDRALAGIAGARRPLRVGWAYATQACAKIPREDWDLRLHAVCTENRLIEFSQEESP